MPPRTRSSVVPAVSPLVWMAVSLATALVATACGGGTASEGSPVMATTVVWADITSQVTCGDLDVPSLVPAGADAHSHETDVHDADALRGARLVVANGFGLEERLDDALATVRDDGVEVLDVAPLVTSAGSDPHVWMDPDLAAAAVPSIAEALRRTEGVGVAGDRIDRCAREYAEALRALGREMDETLSVVPADRRLLVTNHESLGHFARRFDFELVGAVLPSTSSLGEANARDLDALAAEMRRRAVPAVFVDVADDHGAADSLVERLGPGAEVVELHTESPEEGAGYLDMLRETAGSVAAALDTQG